MGYANPLLKLPAAQRLLALPPEQREVIEALMRDLRRDADKLAEQSWKKRKGPMAAYWRAVATYARHVAHALSKGTHGERQEGQPREAPAVVEAPARLEAAVLEA